MNRTILALICAAVLFTSCTVGPNYRRPAMQTPPAFRAPTPLPSGEFSSLADLKWFEVFKDERLQDLERTALIQSYDLRDAVARVEAARARLGVVRSEQYPNFRSQRGSHDYSNFTKRLAAVAGSYCAVPKPDVRKRDSRPALF